MSATSPTQDGKRRPTRAPTAAGESHATAVNLTGGGSQAWPRHLLSCLSACWPAAGATFADSDALCGAQTDVKALRTSLQGRTLDFLLQSIDFQHSCSSEVSTHPCTTRKAAFTRADSTVAYRLWLCRLWRSVCGCMLRRDRRAKRLYQARTMTTLRPLRFVFARWPVAAVPGINTARAATGLRKAARDSARIIADLEQGLAAVCPRVDAPAEANDEEHQNMLAWCVLLASPLEHQHWVDPVTLRQPAVFQLWQPALQHDGNESRAHAAAAMQPQRQARSHESSEPSTSCTKCM